MTRSKLPWAAPAILALSASATFGTLRVVATTPEYGAIASTIGGEKVTVSVLAKPTEDPHFVDPRPSHIVTLNRADLLIEGGADLEVGWLPSLIEGARNPKLATGAPGRVRAADGVHLIDVPAALDRSAGDVHAVGNPHFMMEPHNAAIVASHLTDALCALDPDSAPAFRSRRDAFLRALDERMKAWEARLAPYRGMPIVTYHATWKYFARHFDLVSEIYLEPKPGIPPSPPHLASVMEAMTAKKIRVILVEPFQSRKTAEMVAAKTGARIADVCQFPGGIKGTDGDYLALIDAVVASVASAFEAAGTR